MILSHHQQQQHAQQQQVQQHQLTKSDAAFNNNNLKTDSSLNKVRKRSANQAYEYLTSMPDSKTFQEWLLNNETDFTWVHKRNSMTNAGKKYYYICNYRIKKGYIRCPAVIYALFPNSNDQTVMVYSCGEHEHRRNNGMSCESSPSNNNVNIKIMPSSPTLLSPTSNLKHYQQILPNTPSSQQQQRQRALSKSSQLQQDYKKHMAAASFNSSGLSGSLNIKQDPYENDEYDNNEDQENYHNFSQIHHRQSNGDENNNSTSGNNEENTTGGKMNSQSSQESPNLVISVNKRKKPTVQNFENLDFGDTADELDTEYDNIDEYDQTAISNHESTNLDEDEEKNSNKKARHGSISNVFIDDDNMSHNNTDGTETNRFQFPVLTDNNNTMPIIPAKIQRPRGSQAKKQLAAQQQQQQQNSTCPNQRQLLANQCNQSTNQQVKSHLVQALTQNSLLINSTKELRQIRAQHPQQQQYGGANGIHLNGHNSASSLTTIINNNNSQHQNASRKRAHTHSYETGECAQLQSPSATSLLAPSSLNSNNFSNHQSLPSNFLGQQHSGLSVSNIISPTLLNNYIQ